MHPVHPGQLCLIMRLFTYLGKGQVLELDVDDRPYSTGIKSVSADLYDCFVVREKYYSTTDLYGLKPAK